MFRILKNRTARHKARVLEALDPWDCLTVPRVAEESGLREGRARYLLFQMEFMDGTVVSGWEDPAAPYPRRRVYSAKGK